MSNVIDFMVARMRLHRATWMPDPEAWVWHTPDGRMQGFGHFAQADPGLANLLWLTLDRFDPPVEYACRDNVDYVNILLHSARIHLNGHLITEQAESLTLRQFRDELRTGRVTGVEPRFVARMLALANKRLEHALA